jgi:hypothetical protein
VSRRLFSLEEVGTEHGGVTRTRFTLDKYYERQKAFEFEFPEWRMFAPSSREGAGTRQAKLLS